MAAGANSKSRLLAWLTLAAVLIGILTTLSYATGASTALRIARPAAGAWLASYEFHLMEGAATALGILIGIRSGRRLVTEAVAKSRGAYIAVILGLIILAPLTHLCATAARLGWGARSAAIASWIVGMSGYATGKYLDKLLIAGVYFLKTAGFAFLAGLGLFALAAAALIVMGADGRKVAASSEQPLSPSA
ncbi:MAG: hypothetical protein ACREQN_12720 [Candidatus Binataceae bacterium]